MSPDDETEFYEPEPISLADGEAVIFDRAEFEQDFNCYAAMCREGALFVLCRETRKWVTVEGRGLEPTKPSGRLTRVQ
jgi:hypothetical protein